MFLFEIRPAHVHERVSTTSFLGNSKSNHFGAQGTLKGHLVVLVDESIH